MVSLSCPECNDVITSISVSCTEVYYLPFRDSSGNTHTHDRNSVSATLTCKNGHKSSPKLGLQACPVHECNFGSILTNEVIDEMYRLDRKMK